MLITVKDKIDGHQRTSVVGGPGVILEDGKSAQATANSVCNAILLDGTVLEEL